MITTVQFNQFKCVVRKASYYNDRIALQLIDVEDGAPIATASVNIPEEEVNSDEVLIKNYSENTGMSEALMKAGIIGPVIRKPHAQVSLHKVLL